MTPFENAEWGGRRLAGWALAVCCLAAANVWAEDTSRLSDTYVPLQPQAHIFLGGASLANGAALADALAAGADAPDTPAGRVWGLLEPPVQAQLKERTAGAPLDTAIRNALVAGLNLVLKQPGLYDAKVWADAPLRAKEREALEAGFEGLSPPEVAAKNRPLLDAAFPGLIEKSDTPPFPGRPRMLHLFGDPFLKPGLIQKGITLPTGAVWQPSLFAYGTLRTAWQYMDTGDYTPSRRTARGVRIPGEPIEQEEWVNRLDLFFNLYLTPTERIVAGFRPLDDQHDFLGYQWQPDDEDHGGNGELDSRMEVLFFEGDLGELVPNWDPYDKKSLDIAFSIGRQPLYVQEGLMINDIVDAFGLTKNNIPFPGTSNLRITGMWGWQNVNRGVGAGNDRDDSADLFGLFTSFDVHRSSVDFDVSYVNANSYPEQLAGGSFRERGGSQWNIGLSLVQRIGNINTAFRINHSSGTGAAGGDAADGTLLFGELSWSPLRTHDLLYGNFFLAMDDYRSAARGANTGGPLGRTGILFESPGMGALGSPMTNTANESYGGAIGYQKLFVPSRQQVVAELGGRFPRDNRQSNEFGLGLRYQKAFGQHYVLRLDAFHVERENKDDRDGVRCEVAVSF